MKRICVSLISSVFSAVQPSICKDVKAVGIPCIVCNNLQPRKSKLVRLDKSSVVDDTAAMTTGCLMPNFRVLRIYYG